MSDNTQPEVSVSANLPDGSEAAEISSAVDEGAPVQGGTDFADSTEPFLTVKYNKKQTGLSRDEAKTYAQKGMNYDKVFGRLQEANEKLKAFEKTSESKLSGADRRLEVDKQLYEFLKSNPGVDPAGLPEDVLDAWKSGVPLCEAAAVYQAEKYLGEIENLKSQILMLKTNEQNAEASMGRPSSNGSAQTKPLTAEAIKKMSRKEIDNNIDRIWEYLTGVKKQKKLGSAE